LIPIFIIKASDNLQTSNISIYHTVPIGFSFFILANRSRIPWLTNVLAVYSPLGNLDCVLLTNLYQSYWRREV